MDEAQEDEPEELCEECGQPAVTTDGLCYRCQAIAHALGLYNMDGD
jgi:hypothetical protein